MSILRLDGVRREIGDFVILDSVSAVLARGQRVGLVGGNGAGKTTLLEIIAGAEEADGGEVHVARGVRLGLLTQEANLDHRFITAPTVRAVVRTGAVEVERMERELALLEADGAEAVQSPRYAALRDRFEAADGYHLDQRVEESLAGLGIPRSHWDHPPSELSGGEQTRVALARLLTADPELLMLDEPTNHLDIAALEWLEATLVRRAGALLVASHDRAFLDNVVERVWELRARHLASFKGAYSAYLLQRESADARARNVADSTATAIAREEELVQRYRSQRKHVKMHEHERRLATLREGRAEAPRSAVKLSLPGSGIFGGSAVRAAEIVVSLDAVLCGYPAADGNVAVPITRVARLELRRGERVGLVGPNGAGKSTLLRTLAGSLAALEGYVRIGKNVMPGYLSQLRDRPLGGTNVLDALVATAPVTPGQARSYLARFLFRGDDVLKPVSALSGGERSRLELALLGVGATNLLLLDEPTNHLDIAAREALETFLREFGVDLADRLPRPAPARIDLSAAVGRRTGAGANPRWWRPSMVAIASGDPRSRTVGRRPLPSRLRPAHPWAAPTLLPRFRLPRHLPATASGRRTGGRRCPRTPIVGNVSASRPTSRGWGSARLSSNPVWTIPRSRPISWSCGGSAVSWPTWTAR